VSAGRFGKRQIEEKIKPVGRKEGKAMGSKLTVLIYENYVGYLHSVEYF
jgi:hypothetical protein